MPQILGNLPKYPSNYDSIVRQPQPNIDETIQYSITSWPKLSKQPFTIACGPRQVSDFEKLECQTLDVSDFEKN